MFRDFKELLSAFNAHRVKYLLVGGYAVSFHAQRATKDLDLLISSDAENSKAVYAALAQFGAPVEGLSAQDFTSSGSFFRMGTPPVMVDMEARSEGREQWLKLREQQAKESPDSTDNRHETDPGQTDAAKGSRLGIDDEDPGSQT